MKSLLIHFVRVTKSLSIIVLFFCSTSAYSQSDYGPIDNIAIEYIMAFTNIGVIIFQNSNQGNQFDILKELYKSAMNDNP